MNLSGCHPMESKGNQTREKVVQGVAPVFRQTSWKPSLCRKLPGLHVVVLYLQHFVGIYKLLGELHRWMNQTV